MFASWCVPCRAEHPLLMALAERGVVINGINYKDRPSRRQRGSMSSATRSRGSAPIARPGRIDLGVYGVPETFVIDRDGRIRHKFVGPLQPRDIEETLLPLLAQLGRERDPVDQAGGGAMRRLLGLLLACLVAVAAGGGAGGDQPRRDPGGPGLEQRARGLWRQLRCLVCQNQSIDDSDADLARDLRRIVREQLLAGRSDEEIIGYLTARYGDFVLLKPPVKPATWGLWFGPAAVLLIAAAGSRLLAAPRRARPMRTTPELSADERRRLEALLREDSPAPRS